VSGAGTSRALEQRVASVFSAVDPLRAALDYHLDRQNVLASNVAHVDTPGYKPNDLERVDPSGGFTAALGVAMSRTNERHLLGGALDATPNGRVFQDLSAGVGNDGNYVSLDREAAKLAANQLRYDTVSAIVSAELKQLTFAASDAKG
jgi:flagellar basal-body rod protein FlgB